MSDLSDSRGGKRASADSEDSSRKRAKKDEREEKYNPYLAHMDQDGTNGYDEDGIARDSPLAGMKRHKTTAAQAGKAEDSSINPFTGKSHSQQYFKILQTRRDLPVSQQR